MSIKTLVGNINTEIKNTPIEKITSEVLETLRDMIETMSHNNMSFITGPDIGIHQRLVVLDGTSQNFNVLMMINPHLTPITENKCFVEYNDIDGRSQTVILVDDLAKDIKSALGELGE